MPLNGLLKKNVLFEWSPECQEAFLTLKQRFMEEPVLSMLDQTQPFQIKSDTSKYASGAVLTQTNSNGDRPLCPKLLPTQNDNTKYVTENF